MKRHVRKITALVTLASMLVTGCAPTRPFYFFEDGDLSHYRSVATEIEYPDVLSSTVGSEAWNSRDLKSRPH